MSTSQWGESYSERQNFFPWFDREKYGKAKVAIFGLTMGSVAANQLVRKGIGALDLVDPDVVMPANVSRSVYHAGDIGNHKAFALTSILAKAATNSTLLRGFPVYTEVNALHPEYRPGRANYEWNKEKRTWPVIAYVAFEDELIGFVKKHAATRMVCYGVNGRSSVLTNERGYVRSAVDADIEFSQNLLLDFDFQDKTSIDKRIPDFESFLTKADQYFKDQELKVPVRANSGRGYHLLFAYPRISTKEHPDIRSRIKEFGNRFEREFRQELSGLEVKLDDTSDLKRMVKIYGTAKPGVGVISRFYGNERIEDPALHTYLLHLVLPEPERTGLQLSTAGCLPGWFSGLLEADAELRSLWQGIGKAAGDTSRSGYDFGIARRLLYLGHRNIDEIATILALRPNGGVQQGGKPESYVLRTIASALMK